MQTAVVRPKPSAHFDPIVSVFSDKGDQLLLIQPYKLFQRQDRTERQAYALRQSDVPPVTETFYTQNGRWFDAGKQPVEPKDVPEWVWAECRAMSAGDQSLYKIILPEDAAQGAGLWDDADTGSDAALSFRIRALTEQKLDPKDDTQWTSGGFPQRGVIAMHLKMPVPAAFICSIWTNAAGQVESPRQRLLAAAAKKVKSS